MSQASVPKNVYGQKPDLNNPDVACRTAQSLGVNFHEVVVDEEQLAADFEEATWYCEQHYFDLGFVAKHTLSRFTEHVGLKVVLNGITSAVARREACFFDNGRRSRSG